MGHAFLREEGIILKTIPFRDYDLILVIFTAQAGLIKVFCKGARSKKRGIEGVCNPLTGVEVIYVEGKGELFSCHEISLRESYRQLRESFSAIEAACELLRAIEVSQLVGKSVPRLYESLVRYLKKIQTTPVPWGLVSSFYLKILFHEGLLSIPFNCAVCGENIFDTCFEYNSEWFCSNHCSQKGTSWDFYELKMLYELVSSLRLDLICSLDIPESFKNKVEKLFYHLVRM